MPNFLRQPTWLIVASSVLLAIIAVIRAFVAPSVVDTAAASGMPLSVWLEGAREFSPILYVALVVLAVVCCMVNVLSTSLYSIETGRRTTLPLQIWVLFGCGVVFPQHALTAYVAAFIMTMALKRVARSFKRSYSFGAVFSASFAFGILPLLYAPFAVLYALLPIVWTMTRRTLREFVVGGVGLILPLLATAYIELCRGGEFGHIFEVLGGELSGVNYLGVVRPSAFVFSVVVVWFAAALTITMTTLADSALLRTKPRTMCYVHSVLLVGLLVSVFLGGSDSSLVPSLAVLIALLSPNAFGRDWALVSTISCVAFAVIVVVYNIIALSA